MRTRVDEVLAVVQQQQDPALVQPTADVGRGIGVGPDVEADSPRDGGRDRRAVGQLSEADQPAAVTVGAGQFACERQRDGGLARTSRTGDRDDAVYRERLAELKQLGLASDQRVQGGSDVAAGRLRGCRRRERGVVGQDLALQLPERGRRRETEALVEHAVAVLVDLQRLRGATAAVQREHQLAAEPLPQWMRGKQRLRLADDLLVATCGQTLLQQLLQRVRVQLQQPGALGPGPVQLDHVLERVATPQRQRLGEPPGRQEPLEGHEVDLDPVGEAVAGRLVDHGPRKRPAQLGDAHLQRVDRVGRQPRPPQPVDQTVGAERTSSGRRQHRQQAPLRQRQWDRRGVGVVPHHEPAEHIDLHHALLAWTVPTASRGEERLVGDRRPAPVLRSIPSPDSQSCLHACFPVAFKRAVDVVFPGGECGEPIGHRCVLEHGKMYKDVVGQAIDGEVVWNGPCVGEGELEPFGVGGKVDRGRPVGEVVHDQLVRGHRCLAAGASHGDDGKEHPKRAHELD